jgi:hypothetical protein
MVLLLFFVKFSINMSLQKLEVNHGQGKKI